MSNMVIINYGIFQQGFKVIINEWNINKPKIVAAEAQMVEFNKEQTEYLSVQS